MCQQIFSESHQVLEVSTWRLCYEVR